MNDLNTNTTSERILVFPFDLMSHYLRCIELAKTYTNAEIFFASSARYDHFVKKAGYKVFQVENFNADTVMDCAVKFDFSWLNKQDIERIFLSQVNAIKLFKPQLVIGDTSPSLKMAAEFTNVSYTALMNGYMSRYYSLVRMLPKSHPGYAYISRLPPALGKTIISFAEKISFRIVHKPFRKLRSKYGLKPVFDYLSEMEGDINLLCDDEFLFPQKKLPKHYRIIGPLMYNNDAADDGLTDILTYNKKIICVCMGSSGSWEQLAFLSSANYSNYVIVTAGDSNNFIKGNHVIAKPFVSLEKLLPFCSMLICHGGNGTIYHGIKHKIPMLCLTNHFEQEWNVQRLESLKLGYSININPEEKLNYFLKHKKKFHPYKKLNA